MPQHCHDPHLPGRPSSPASSKTPSLEGKGAGRSSPRAPDAGDRDWEGLHWEEAILRAGRDYLPLLPRRSHVLLHTAGERRFQVDGDCAAARYRATPGRLDYFPAGTCDGLSSSGGVATLLIVGIPVAFENSVQGENAGPVELLPRLQFADHRLERLVLSLPEARALNLPGCESVLLSIALVDRLVATGPGRAGAPPALSSLLRRLLAEYIDNHLGESVDLRRLAFLSGLSRTRFGDAFRASFGNSPNQYVLTRKVEVALVRLVGDVSIGELAYELGFSSQAHFSTVFKKYVGRTPSEVRLEAGTGTGTGTVPDRAA